LTAVDEVDPQILASPESMYRSRAVERIILNVSSKTGVAKTNIFPVMNYVHNSWPAFSPTDAILFLALKELRTMAETYARVNA